MVNNCHLKINPIELEQQAKRAEEQATYNMTIPENHQLPALLQNIPSAPVVNRRKERKRHYETSLSVVYNLDDARLDLHRWQLANQQIQTLASRIPQNRENCIFVLNHSQVLEKEHFSGNELSRQTETRLEEEKRAQVHRDEDTDALYYGEQQILDDNRDLYVNRDII